VKQLLAGEVWQYRRGSLTQLAPTRHDQVEAMRRLCDQMLQLMPEVSKLGGQVPTSASSAIERLLSLVED
jgi:hypothetical protein